MSAPAISPSSRRSYARAAFAAMLRGLYRVFNTNKTSWIGLALFLAVILRPVIATHDPLEQDILTRLEAPSAEHWMGTDNYGRDIFSRLLYGARISLVIGLGAIAIALVIGSILGLIAGYYGGRTDT